MTPRPPTPKRSRAQARADDDTKRTNETGTVIPLLDQLDTIAGKTVTADALLTQRKLASYLLERNAHSLFTAKNNQPNLLLDIALQFVTEGTRKPDFEEPLTLSHGRTEQRAIWISTALNHSLDFPGVGQVFMLRRSRLDKASPAQPAPKPSMASPATPQSPPMPKRSSPSTEATGASKIPPTTVSTGPSTRTDAASAPATARTTPPACDASPSNSSKHADYPSPRLCDDSTEMSAASSTSSK